MGIVVHIMLVGGVHDDVDVSLLSYLATSRMILRVLPFGLEQIHWKCRDFLDDSIRFFLAIVCRRLGGNDDEVEVN